jgi:hypothetical protein
MPDAEAAFAPTPDDFPDLHPLLRFRRIAEAIRSTAPTNLPFLPIESDFWKRWGEPSARHATFVRRMVELAELAVQRISIDRHWDILRSAGGGLQDHLSALICCLSPQELADTGNRPMSNRLGCANAPLDYLRPAFGIIEALQSHGQRPDGRVGAGPPRQAPEFDILESLPGEPAPPTEPPVGGAASDPPSGDRLIELVSKWTDRRTWQYAVGRVLRRDQLFRKMAPATDLNPARELVNALFAEWDEIERLVRTERPEVLCEFHKFGPPTGALTEAEITERHQSMNRLLGLLLTLARDQRPPAAAQSGQRRGNRNFSPAAVGAEEGIPPAPDDNQSDPEIAEAKYDPCDREPETLDELAHWAARWKQEERNLFSGPRLPVVATSATHEYLARYCIDEWGGKGLDLERIHRLQSRYSRQTGTVGAELAATTLRQIADHFRQSAGTGPIADATKTAAGGTPLSGAIKRTESERPPEDDKPNGPFAPNGFQYAGIKVRFGRASKQYGLVRALWDDQKNAPYEPRPVGDVIDTVWGEENDTEDSTFRQLCSDTRRRLQAANCPLDITQVNGTVQLIPIESAQDR